MKTPKVAKPKKQRLAIQLLNGKTFKAKCLAFSAFEVEAGCGLVLTLYGNAGDKLAVYSGVSSVVNEKLIK